MCDSLLSLFINAKYLQKLMIQFKINSTNMGEKNEDCLCSHSCIFQFMLSYIIDNVEGHPEGVKGHGTRKSVSNDRRRKTKT
jgi:hypothetical protein